MDLFDDVIDSGASIVARAGGKFQPKCNPRPRRQPSTLVSSALGRETKEMNYVVSQPCDTTENLAIHEALAMSEVLSNANDENVESSSLESVKHASEVEGFKDSMTLDGTANAHSNRTITTAVREPAAELKLSPCGSILFEEPMANDCFVRKFQPRMKPCLRKDTSVSIVSALDSVGTDNSSTSTSLVETDRCVGTRKDSEVALAPQSSTTSEIIRSKELLTENCDMSVKFSDGTNCSGLLNCSLPGALSVQNGKVPAVSGSETVSDGSADFLSSLHKSAVENVDIFSGLDCLDDYLNQPARGEERIGCNQTSTTVEPSQCESVENEKPVRKRKVSGEGARNKSREKGPKRFPHSTRRKKRYGVDKTLLDTPEDEIDFSKIRFKDLIIYHEYKERLAKKKAKTQLRDDRAATKEGSHDGEEEFASEQQIGSDDDDEAYIKVDLNSEYFNYHTYMKKTPRVKWSKQDTELFYEAVRQFGTDFYMIQQLFPGRTHHQIKLKFKNEERQHPLQISEALTSRSKDHFHFISLMERLQQDSAQEKCKSDEDEMIESKRKESELKPETNEEAEKSELDEENNIKNKEGSSGEVLSPSKSYDEDDDPYKWSQYNSDL